MFDHFPTSFAMMIAYSSGLLPVGTMVELSKIKRADEGWSDAMKMHICLKEFQSLAVINNFEDSLIAFHGVTLNKEQKLALEIIHKNMPTFARGLITSSLLNRVASATDKELVQISALLIEILSETDPFEKDDKLLTAKKFIVKVSS